MKEYDAIVIGRGPAGISASIYLKRGNLNVLVIGKDKGTLEQVHEIENVYSLGKTTGNKIQSQGEQHAKELGIEIIESEVLRIEFTPEGYVVKTKDEDFKTSFIFLGIGFKRKKLNIENIGLYDGKGVSYCAVCDGFFYKNKDVGVYGNSEYAIEEAGMLLNTANKIFILTDGNKAIDEMIEFQKENSDKVEVKKEKIQKMYGGDHLEGIEFTNGSQINTQGFFIAEEANNKSFAMQLGFLMEGESIVVDENRKTNVPGIYAGGDATKGIKQVVKAINDGMLAALDIIKEFNLKKFKK